MNKAPGIWSERALQYGRRAAMNLGIAESEIANETARIENVLFPLLQAELSNAPTRILDFGCGWGRFTEDLALFTHAEQTVGYDPTAELVALATPPGARSVRYSSGPLHEFFRGAVEPFDLIWVHAVLGGIADNQLPDVALQLAAALAPGGLLFCVEDTAPPNPQNTFWRVREERVYLDIFSSAGLTAHVAGTLPTRFGEIKSVFAARKPQ